MLSNFTYLNQCTPQGRWVVQPQLGDSLVDFKDFDLSALEGRWVDEESSDTYFVTRTKMASTLDVSIKRKCRGKELSSAGLIKVTIDAVKWGSNYLLKSLTDTTLQWVPRHHPYVFSVYKWCRMGRYSAIPSSLGMNSQRACIRLRPDDDEDCDGEEVVFRVPYKRAKKEKVGNSNECKYFVSVCIQNPIQLHYQASQSSPSAKKGNLTHDDIRNNAIRGLASLLWFSLQEHYKRRGFNGTENYFLPVDECFKEICNTPIVYIPGHIETTIEALMESIDNCELFLRALYDRSWSPLGSSFFYQYKMNWQLSPHQAFKNSMWCAPFV